MQRRVCYVYSTIINAQLYVSVLSQLEAFAGSNLAGDDGLFQSVEILSMTSFGREVEQWVP